MNILEILTGKEYSIEIISVEKSDFKLFKEDKFFFDWRVELNQEVYKLQIIGSNDVLGLVSLERFPDEWRIHIRLLTVSKDNKGSKKKYDKIAGNLIAHVAKIAVVEFGELACISLRPKTELAQHYIDKYKMNVTGLTLSLEVPEILDLINLYDHD